MAALNKQSWCGAGTATESPTEPLAWAGSPRCHLGGGRGMGLLPLLGWHRCAVQPQPVLWGMFSGDCSFCFAEIGLDGP